MMMPWQLIKRIMAERHHHSWSRGRFVNDDVLPTDRVVIMEGFE